MLAGTSPKGATQAFALLAVAVAFMSASQDVVIDAYRTDLLPAHERGLGASMAVAGYRLAMILSGGIALIWTDSQQGGGWSWPEVYRLMAWLMVGTAAVSATLLPRLVAPAMAPANSVAIRHDLLGFVAVVAAVAVGYAVTDRLVAPAVRIADGAAVARQCARRRAAGALGRPGLAAGRHRHHVAAGGLGGAPRPLRNAAVGAGQLLQPTRRGRRSCCSSCCTSSATPSPAR